MQSKSRSVVSCSVGTKDRAETNERTDMAEFVRLLLTRLIAMKSIRRVRERGGGRWCVQIVQDWYGYITQFVWPPVMILHTITIWLTVLVTVDRYWAVCRAVERYGSSGTAARDATRRRVVAVVALAVVYNSPRFFEHQARAVARTFALPIADICPLVL